MVHGSPIVGEVRRRPLAGWLVAAAVAALLGYGLGVYLTAGEHATDKQAAQRDVKVVGPDARLPPAAVVKLQLEGLARETGDLAGIEQCFALASPLNRQATGPLERFATMVAAKPYDVLLRPELATLGDAQIDGNQAEVTVAVVGNGQTLHVFRFLLSRQTQAPYAGCWMTDAVYLVGVARQQSTSESTTPDSPI